MLYPTAANWFAALNHNNALTEYSQSINGLSQEERRDDLAQADLYNIRLPRGPLQDPFTSQAADAATGAQAYADYESLLDYSENGVMGRVHYPEIGIDLPISHGTSDTVISNGAGHVYGSSLPVGGQGTHSVLTAHSGLANARLFTPLHDAEIGQLFTVEVAGTNLFYRVDEIRVVAADDLQALSIVEAEDFVTLLTCTPVGINSHRLLVRGERITPPDNESFATSGDSIYAGFPWWAVIFVGGSSAVFLITRTRREHDDAVSAQAVDVE